MVARILDIKNMQNTFDQMQESVIEQLRELLGKMKVPAIGETSNGPIPDPSWVLHIIMSLKQQQAVNIGQLIILTSVVETLISKSLITDEALEEIQILISKKLKSIQDQKEEAEMKIAVPKKGRIQLPPGAI